MTPQKLKMRLAWTITILATIIILAGLTMGCTSSVEKVATSQNAYDYFFDRLPQVCKAHKEPDFCKRYVELLNQYEHDLHLSSKALQAGGKFPRQLDAIKKDEKAVAEASK